MLLGDKYKGENKRARFDRYNTPIEPVIAFCHKVYDILTEYTHYPNKYSWNVLDPCAGDGRWGTVYKSLFQSAELTGVDVDPMVDPAPEFDVWHNYDFLQKDFGDEKFHTIISNPPFSLSEEFIHKGLSVLAHSGVMAYMLNLTFMSSIGREQRLFNAGLNPTKIIVSSRRIDFTGQGSPHTEIGMFVWDKSCLGEPTTVEWIDWEKYYEEQKDRFGLGWGSVSLR